MSSSEELPTGRDKVEEASRGEGCRGCSAEMRAGLAPGKMAELLALTNQRLAPGTGLGGADGLSCQHQPSMRNDKEGWGRVKGA